MNKKQVALTLGIMCFLLCTAIVIQIKTMNNASSTASQTLSDNGLRDEVLKWKERYDNVYAQLKKSEETLEVVREKATQNDNTAANKQEQLKENNMLLGLTTVTGDGIEIELQDNSAAEGDSLLSPDSLARKLVHNGDLLSLVNELKNAGAEAIEINGQRIVNTTAITCEGNVIKVNGEKIGSPFIIKAIGSQGLLYGQLVRPGSYAELLKEDGINISIRKSNNIVINKYNGVISFKYTNVQK